MKLTRILSAACGGIGLSAFLLFAAGPAPTPALPASPAQAEAVTLADESGDDFDVSTAKVTALARIELMSQSGLYSGSSVFMAKEKVARATSQTDIDNALIALAKTAYGKSYYITSGSNREGADYTDRALMLGDEKVTVAHDGSPDAWIIKAPSDNVTIDDINKIIIQSKKDQSKFWGNYVGETVTTEDGTTTTYKLSISETGSPVTIGYTNPANERISITCLQPSGLGSDTYLNLSGGAGLTHYFSNDPNSVWVFTPADDVKTSTDSEEHWYTIKSVNRGTYLSSNGVDEAQAGHYDLGSASYPIQLWKAEAGIAEDAITLKGLPRGNAGNALYLYFKSGAGGFNKSSASDLFILDNSINKFGVVISGENSISGLTCFCANNAASNHNVLYWYPAAADDWKQTSWLFEEVDPEYLDYYQQIHYNVINKTSEGYFISNKAVDAVSSDTFTPDEIANFIAQGTVDIYAADGTHTIADVNSNFTPADGSTIVVSYTSPAHIEAAKPTSLTNDFSPYVNVYIWDCHSERGGFRNSPDAETAIARETGYPKDIASILWVLEPTGGDNEYKFRSVKHGGYIGALAANTYANATQADAVAYSLSPRADGFYDIKSGASYWNGDGESNAYHLVGWSDGHPYLLMNATPYLYYEVTENWIAADGVASDDLPSALVSKVTPGEAFTSTSALAPGLSVQSTAYSDGATENDLAAVTKDITITYTVGADNAVKPITLLSNDRNPNAYVSVSDDGTTLSSKTAPDASTVWIPYPVEGEDGKYTLFNPYINKYLASIPLSSAGTLTGTQSEAAKVAISTDSEGRWILDARSAHPDDNTPAYHCLHMSGSMVPVGWESGAGASAWTVTYPDAETINGYTAAMVAALDFPDELVTSIANTGILAETVITEATEAISAANTQKDAFDASTLPATDAKEAAEKISDYSGVIARYRKAVADIDISGRKVILINNRQNTTGCTATNLDGRYQYKYCGYIGINDTGTLNFAGPVNNTQSSFEIVDNKLYLKLADHYVKADASSNAINMVTAIAEATPITIQKNGDASVIVLTNGKGALNIASYGTNLVSYSSLTDEGAKFTIKPLEDFAPQAGGEGYYFIMTYSRWVHDTDANSGAFLTAPFTGGVIPADGTLMQHTTVSPLAIWKITPGSVDGAVHFESLADGYYLGQEAGTGKGVLSKTPADWFITANGANNGTGYSIRVASDGQGLDAANYDPSVALWTPSPSDWAGTNWVFAPVNEDYVAECRVQLLSALKTDANSRLDNLKLITQLFDADDIDEAKNKVEAAETKDAVNAAVDEAIKTAAGKTIYIYVIKSGTSDNYYITDMGAGNDVKGVKDGGENDAWAFEAVADGIVLKNNDTGLYLSKADHFQTSSNVADAVRLDVSSAADGSYIYISVPAAGSNDKICFNGNHSYLEYYSDPADPHNKWHLETVRVNASQAAAIAALEELKTIEALYNADEIDAAIADIEALDSDDNDLAEKIDAIVTAAKHKADGKTVSIWVQYQTVTPNAPRWMTDVDGKVRGVADATTGSYWTLRLDAESGYYRLRNNNGAYMGPQATFTTVAASKDAGLFDIVPLADGLVAFSLPDHDSDSRYLNINRNGAITLYTKVDPHSKWHLVSLEQDLEMIQEEVAAAKEYVADLPDQALLSGSSSIKNAVIRDLNSIDLSKASGSDLIEAIVNARTTVGQADDIVETILEQRSSDNRGLPFQIHRTSRDGVTDVYLSIQSNKVVVSSDASDPSTLWIANFTKPETTSAPAARIMAEGDDDGSENETDNGEEGDGDIYFTLYNPANGLYIQSTPTSASLALTQNAEDAAPFTLNPGNGGVAFYNGENPTATNSAIHLAANDNIVGWQGTPEYSMWMMKDVTAAEVNTMGEAAYPSSEGGASSGDMTAVIASLKNTALWDEETVDALDDVAANGFVPSNDKKVAAASFGNAGAVSRQSLVPITTKRFGLSNKRLFNDGLSGTPVAASQHDYASFIGINTDGTALVTSAPTTKAQWSFNVVGTDLFIINHRREGSTDISQYLKEVDGALSLVSTPDEASAISIADDGDIVFGDGKVLTIDDRTLTMTTADDTDDEGTGFTYYGLRDVITLPDTYFAIMSYNRGGFLTSEHPVSGEALIHGNFNDQALWTLEKANNNGGYYIANFVEGLYLGLSGSNPIISTNKAIWYLTDNGAKNGRGFSIRVSATGTAIDAANQTNGISLWTPAQTDWQGTTWDFAPVPEALLASKTDAKEALYQTIVDKMPSRIEQLRAVTTLFDESQVDKTLASFEEIAADETLTPKEKANLMEAEAQTLFAYAQEVPFMLINKRRYDNAMISNNYGDKGYALYHYQTVDQNGYLDKYEFRTSVRTDYRATWRLEYAGQGTFNLKAGDEAWIGALPGEFNTPFNAVYAADAYHGRFIFVDNTKEGGEKTFGIAQYGHSLEPGASDNYVCVNITQDGEDGVVRWVADDDGSRWIAMLPSETLNREEDVDGVYVISSYKRGSKLLGVTPGVMIDPLSTPVTGVEPGPGAFWQLTKTGDQTYTLLNLFTDRYLAHDLTWTEEPVDWFITPNAASDEDWKSSNLGLSISIDENRSKCIDMGSNGNLSLWRPSENDFEGTTWVITRSELSTASKMARTNYNADKVNYEAKWIPDYLGEVAEMIPSWASDPLYTANSDYAEIKDEMAKASPAAINYVELLARRNALWNQLQDNLNKTFIEEGASHAIQLINNRRADRFNEFNTEHLLASTSAGASMVSYDDNKLESSTIWHIQPADDGTSFHITTEDGKYLGGADAPASLFSDKAKAGKFNIRYVIFSTYEDGDYRPNYGIALAYAGANTGLHGALTANAPMNYYVNDPGSFWRLNNADFLGIDNVTVTDGSFDLSECDLFTLDGRRISRADAAPGIYVARRADGRAVKVVIR